MIARYIGHPQNRVDGRAKVTGMAKYAGEFNVPKLLHGAVVSGTITKGRITKIDAEAALAVKGVAQVFTHENHRRLDGDYKDEAAPPGSPFRPLYDDRIYYNGQPIALVVAESFEIARFASSLVRVEYAEEEHETDLRQVRDQGYIPEDRAPVIPLPREPRGQPREAMAAAPVRYEGEYTQPSEFHNPIEPNASTVVYEPGGRLTVYEKTQGAQNTQSFLCNVFGLAKEQVRILSPFVGGAFGLSLRPHYHLFLAVMAALELKRSVRVVLTRHQMFSLTHRPETIQDITLGASIDGKLQSIFQEGLAETSQYEDHSEALVTWSEVLYQCDNAFLEHKVARLDRATPGDMRAPGAPTGTWALESAIDELAVKLKMDPLELRLKNYAERDQSNNKPFSSKQLRECFRQGAEKFGWARRKPEPRSMREGHNLIGWGMATGSWDAFFVPARAKAILAADGRLEVSSATADIGTGTYTIMAQIAADTLGLPIENVTARLGDSSLSTSWLEGGSWTAASTGSAVKVVCEKVCQKLFELARGISGSEFANAKFEDVIFSEGKIALRDNPVRGLPFSEVLRKRNVPAIEEETDNTYEEQSPKQEKYARNTFSAVFVEARVDEDLGTIHIPRVVSAVAAGRILNPKTARSQVVGSVVWGIGMALHEEGLIDQNFGRVMNHSLAEYHVPVNADVHDIDVIFVEEHDDIVNPLGVKGVGEIGIVGVAAAIGNAIYHATGKRIKNLPITLDKLIDLD